jgi:hypothetical protein
LRLWAPDIDLELDGRRQTGHLANVTPLRSKLLQQGRIRNPSKSSSQDRCQTDQLLEKHAATELLSVD